MSINKNNSVSMKTLLHGLPQHSYRYLRNDDHLIDGITWDYKKVFNNSLYFCVEDEEFQENHIETNSFSYWEYAIRAGASCLVVKKDTIIKVPSGVSLLEVDDVNQAMAVISKNFYGSPLSGMQIIGITGTNGKTTTSQLLDSILLTTDRSIGVIGTIGTFYPSGKQDASHLSNPMSTELFAIGKKMQNEKVDTLIMEVTSHAMAFQRNYAIDFDIALFTNLTQDHLDFHISMDAYKEEKLKFFKKLGRGEKKALGIVNIDDPFSNQFISAIDKDLISSGKVKVFTYGIQNKDADLVAYPEKMNGCSSNYKVIYKGNYLCDIDLPIPGLFNIYNSLAAFGVSLSLGIGVDQIREGLKSARQVDGRFEKVPCTQGFDVFVDYAHTPDALAKIMGEIKKICRRHIIVVFGCGGNRDRSKRSIMGKIASELADSVIITSDNPRSEDSGKINKDILAGVDEKNQSKLTIENDRKKAIYLALNMAVPGDCILIAGKGHENYQIIGDKFHSFSDREMIINRLKSPIVSKYGKRVLGESSAPLI